MWKDFFYFSRTERQGILILTILITLVCTISWFMPARDTEIKDNPESEKEYETFITSIKKREHSPKSDNADHFSQKHKIVLASFDPNTADSSTFLSLGLPSWMAGNILRYRAKGGNFRKPEDLPKIYGLTEKQYKTLLPYFSISTAEKGFSAILQIPDRNRNRFKSIRYHRI